MSTVITIKKSDRILVIGGTGFIGQHLINRCLEDTSNITCINLAGRLFKEKYLNSVEVIQADITRQSQLHYALGGKSFDYVFNLGGYIDHSPFLEGGRNIVDVHYTGTLNLLNQVFTPSLKKLVQIGSSDEYGNGPSPQSENLREAPISPYSAAKVGATHLIQALSKTEGLPGVVVRLFLVYGPGQDDRRFLPQIIKGCLDGRTFPTSAGEQLRDFCYIEDVVEGLILSAVKPKAVGHVINVASGQPITIRAVIEKVVELISNGQPDFGAYPYRTGENMALYGDISLANRLLGWSPETNLEEGLKKTIEYYRDLFLGGQR